MRSGSCRSLSAGFGSLLLLHSFASAQVVELRLREASNLSPIVGAIVRLVDSKGTAIAGLSDELGRVMLRGSAKGIYRIKIDRIGWSGFLSDPFELGQGETVRREIRMTSDRLELPGLVVQAKSGCEQSTQGGALAARLWEEISKALTANLLTQRAQATPLHLREFIREVGRGGEAQRQWVVASRIVRGPPFASFPAERLAREGFVQEEEDSISFAAPDAATILADEFVAGHCFRALPGTGRLAGLAFEPVRGGKAPDVSGTLWVDRATGELRFLEFAYTGLEGILKSAGLGGRVEFQRLVSGRWIVSYWHIRMPRLEVSTLNRNGRPEESARLAGYIDRGGRAEEAMDGFGRVDRAIVQGEVFDSTTGRGLADVVIGVTGTTDSVLVSPDGRFTLAVAASGDRVVTARHPKLGLLGEPTRLSALLSLGDTTSVAFGVPPVSAFSRALCRNSSDRVGIIGVVQDRRGAPAVDREVLAMKSTVRGNVPIDPPRPVTSTTARRQDTHGIPVTSLAIRGDRITGSKTVRTGAQGLFGLCNLPPRGTVQVITVDSGRIQVDIPVALEGQSRWIDVREWGSVDTSGTSIGRIRRVADRESLAGDGHNWVRALWYLGLRPW